MRIETPDNKPRPFLYNLFLSRLLKLEPHNSDVIRFTEIWCKICSSFQISKKDCFELLLFFQEIGALKIIRGHGVIINQHFKKEVKYESQ